VKFSVPVEKFGASGFRSARGKFGAVAELVTVANLVTDEKLSNFEKLGS
jgi:hypothetical protein